MLVITGDTRSKEMVALLQSLGWGRMFIETRIVPYPDEPWGFDNGAFRDWRNGKKFDENRYLKAVDTALEIAKDHHFPYLSVLPDIVAEGIKSLDFSDYWADKLKFFTGSLFDKFNWYVAVQDGMDLLSVEKFIEKHSYIKGIFLGGTDKFKTTAPKWSVLAKKYSLKFHYARAGTPKKYALARLSGADSLDSAFPLWLKERLNQFINKGEKIYEHKKAQRVLLTL